VFDWLIKFGASKTEERRFFYMASTIWEPHEINRKVEKSLHKRGLKVDNKKPARGGFEVLSITVSVNKFICWFDGQETASGQYQEDEPSKALIVSYVTYLLHNLSEP
jgi:hypothetical protein